jgi:hypothetical protein
MGAGVYTIWRHADGSPATTEPGPDQLVYVGLVGGKLTAETIEAQRRAGERRKGLWSRLRAHASGQRSGDQFSVYIADRWVLPTLSPEEIAAVGAGALDLDVRIRSYIVTHLAYRWVVTPDGAMARKIELTIQQGDWDHGKPFLNSR